MVGRVTGSPSGHDEVGEDATRGRTMTTTSADAAEPSRSDGPLPRNVKVLGAVSFAQDTGSEMLYPLLPAFITGVLGAPVVALGVTEGLADAAAAGMKLVSGRLARSGHRRRWIATGYGTAVAGKIIVAASFVWPLVLVGRALDRFGKGIRGVPRDAMIADSIEPGQRGRAFGFHRALDTGGAVLGPILGLGLLSLFGGRIRPALVVAVIPAAISVALVSLVRETPPQPHASHRAPDEQQPAPLPARYWRVLAPLAVFAVVNSTDALLLQRASELGLSVTAVVSVYVLYNTVYAGLGYPAGKLADRIRPRLVFAGGLVIFALVYLGLGRTDSTAAIWILLPCYGGYTALTDGVSRAWVSNLVTDEQRTWALGIHGAVGGVGALVAGLWSGLIWGDNGRHALTISGAVALAVAVWLLLDRDGDPPTAWASTSAIE
jgi:MFS family permease